ncbi:hypothetical protein [Pseudomonas sp. H9]|uniref:hypothetical protein n=1 Tax=Pseudomonas sp. H9 TaxID=483968 RepID=UPI001057A7D7|nr:hypothetical protein [Pseudomonas sp. H9]TDF78227.1 hypothetical protein E1573_23170 [Pseudomonas sp. H9]
MERSLIAKLELGASVIFTIGIALKRVEDQIKKNTEVLEKLFAEGLRPPEEVKPAAASNCCGLGELRPYLDTTLSLLGQQLVALRKPHPVLVQEGSGTATATTDSTPERDNLAAFEDLPVIGPAITYGRAALLPTQISAQFQKIIRDITISAGVADGEKPSLKEQDVIARVKKITTDTGMERNQAATLIKQLYETGMGLDKALDVAPVAAKFSVGQDAAIGDTARLISELQSHPKITDAAGLKRALEFVVSQRKGTGEDAAAPLSDTQRKHLNTVLEGTQTTETTSILDGDLEARRGTSDRHLSEASDAVDNALLSLGDSVRPLSNWVAEVVEEKANAFTEAPNAVKWLTVGVAALGTTLLALKGGTVVRSLLDKVRNQFKGAPIPEEALQGGETLPQPPVKPSGPISPGTVGKIGAALKEVRGPAMLEAGIKAAATFLTADSPEEKAEGYGAAAGGLVGAALGTVLGTFVPVVGPPIGALLGGMAGDAIGGWLGKRLVSSNEEPVAAAKSTDNSPLVAAQPGDVVRSLANTASAVEPPVALANTSTALASPQQVNQQFTFTPNMPITVQGGVSDPTQLVQNLQAMVRRELEELMRMATSRQLSDVPHVYV